MVLVGKRAFDLAQTQEDLHLKKSGSIPYFPGFGLSQENYIYRVLTRLLIASDDRFLTLYLRKLAFSAGRLRIAILVLHSRPFQTTDESVCIHRLCEFFLPQLRYRPLTCDIEHETLGFV